jgi:hypothetical protein
LDVCGKRLGLNGAIRLGVGESQSGGSEKPSIIADAMEAVFGAVFMDGGYDNARRVILDVLDETLKQAAAFFASVFGKDSCFRYGGDEFLVLLQDMPEDEIRRLADRLSEFQVVEFQGRRIPVSVSGGLASADCATVADMRALIRMADDNLYHAKKNGRNQIIGGNV